MKASTRSPSVGRPSLPVNKKSVSPGLPPKPG
jgi:hypothetical protein